MQTSFHHLFNSSSPNQLKTIRNVLVGAEPQRSQPMYMIQFSASGRFIRKAPYNATLAAIWSKQIPYGYIDFVRI